MTISTNTNEKTPQLFLTKKRGVTTICSNTTIFRYQSLIYRNSVYKRDFTELCENVTNRVRTKKINQANVARLLHDGTKPSDLYIVRYRF